VLGADRCESSGLFAKSAFLILTAVFASSCRGISLDRAVRISYSDPPFSSDPVHQDAWVNSLAFRAVYSVLVSKGKRGEYRGVLADRWRSSSDGLEWRFTLRDDLFFETGERVRGTDLLAAWKRLAALAAAENAVEPLFSKLASGPAPAMFLSGRELVLRFREPVPGLLDQLSLLRYSVVHGSCFDPKSGGWLCGRRAISSGPYRVAAWTPQRMRLELRAGFPANTRHRRPLRAIEFGPTPSSETADLSVGASIGDRSSEGKVFWGGLETTYAYVRCQSWTRPESALRDLKIRRRLRTAFYAELEREGIVSPRSFFPPAIPGVRAFSDPPSEEDEAMRGLSAKRFCLRPSWGYHAPIQRAMERVALRFGLAYSENFIPKRETRAERLPGLPSYKNDLVIESLTVDVDDPASALRAAFRDAQGLRLPDPTGAIEAELSGRKIAFQRINETLWSDALVWPVRHYSMGVWAKPDLDLSDVNFAVQPIPLQWVGWKD